MIITDTYRRFRRWQQNAVSYVHSDDTHRCINCDETFKGNFCPTCGQKAELGPHNWKSVKNSILDIWGLGGRSLPRSVWHLLWRPGYLISDYISGKRQVCFPPVKMFIIVTLFFIILKELTDPTPKPEAASISETGFWYWVERFKLWIATHTQWQHLITFTLFIFPTWLIFRESPRNTHHTIPQGFFIQVFFLTQLWLWQKATFSVLPLVSDINLDLYEFPIISLIIFSIFTVDFKVVFGYSWWGTIWRSFCTMGISFALLDEIGALKSLWQLLSGTHSAQNISIFAGFASGLLLIYLVTHFTVIINRKAWCEKGIWHAIRVPVFVLAIATAVFITAMLLL